jgi:hypothetical protein
MFGALFAGPAAYATLGTLPATLATNGVQISVQSYLSGSGVAGGGGGFDGVVKNISGTISQETAFWCVDDQTYFSFMGSNDFARANITTLSSYNAARAADPNDVAFGSSDGTWHNTITPDGRTIPVTSPFDTALGRLEMAAYLVTQYDGFSPYTNVLTTQKNADIQQAIWALTNNSAFNSHSNGTNGFDGGTANTYNASDDGVKSWINAAFTAATASDFSTKVNLDNWAVVSWVVDSNNDLTSPRQTFLVELSSPTPEPGFYGVLALGLSAIALRIGRKKKSA